MQRILSLAFLVLSIHSSAQTRLSLYEEFTGEQCFPCAIANPGLQSLLAANASKVVLLNYPSPVPVAGQLYNVYKNNSNARISYYGINDAPLGRLNGYKFGSGGNSSIAGNVSNLAQADIDSQYARPSPFNLSVSHSWSAGGDSIFIQLTISTPVAYAPPGATFRLRLALVNDLNFVLPPGINGEKSFPNVVQEMYPNPGGTILSGSWAASQSATFTVKGIVPKITDKQSAVIVAWIQNDADKTVQQVAVSNKMPIAIDAAITAAQPISKLQCAFGQASVPSATVLRNTGTVNLTSARIFYHADGGPLSYYDWTGTLAPNSATTILLPAINVGGGNRFITDSVVSPNGVPDINMANNVASGVVNVYNTATVNLPVANGFEGLAGATPSGWLLYDADSNGRNFQITRNVFGGNAGFGNSTYFLLHNNYYVPSGETNFAILPSAKLPNGEKTLTFELAHAPYDLENDQLDVVYSTDCGDSWTSVWNGTGAGMTSSAATTNFFIPTATDWEQKTVDMTAVPNGAIIAFRAISDFGNALYIDNVQLSAPLGIVKDGMPESIFISPQPAKNEAILHFTLSQGGNIQVDIQDMSGRKVLCIAKQIFKKGMQQFFINTVSLASGVYLLRIKTDGGSLVKKLVIAK
ncbi:MAG: choice-of-anchor J domain-containing protein [Chitinophagaceae bacterium]